MDERTASAFSSLLGYVLCCESNQKLWLDEEHCHAPSTASGLFILQQKDSSPPHLSGPVNKGSPFLRKVLCVQYKESGNYRNRDKSSILSSADITGKCHPAFAC